MSNDLPIKYPLTAHDKRVLDAVVQMLHYISTNPSPKITMFGEVYILLQMSRMQRGQQYQDHQLDLDPTWRGLADQLHGTRGFSRDQLPLSISLAELARSSSAFTLISPVLRDGFLTFYREHYPEDYTALVL